MISSRRWFMIPLLEFAGRDRRARSTSTLAHSVI
jgi:hypothetical protein